MIMTPGAAIGIAANIMALDIAGPDNHEIGFMVGFGIVSLAALVGGALWIWGTRYLEEDTRRAPLRLNI